MNDRFKRKGDRTQVVRRVNRHKGAGRDNWAQGQAVSLEERVWKHN